MAFRSKLPPGGLRAAVENNLRDKQAQQDLTLSSSVASSERFKTVKLERADYVGADKTAANCPVSRAIRRALKKGSAVSIDVWVDKVRIGENCYALPAAVTEADRRWCQSGAVTELDFQLSNRKVTP